MLENTIKNEILAPAGSIEALYAGLNAGADAVYIGGKRFGARAYADNPNEDQLLQALDYVHLHGKKLYLTVNTLLKTDEMKEQLYQYLLPYDRQGLDAVIVQDSGVFQFIRENFKKIDIHASTQMTITGVEGASLLKTMGASRVVTARELSLKELKEIHDQVDIEIESFIHGAMCYSYSGQCLFSSMAGGRSGNRGRCAGPCRQPYEVSKNRHRYNDDHSLYALSLKDMNTLSILPQIIESGVFSLKIEGRMKSPEYVAGVVSIYRKYLDLYWQYGKEKYRILKEDAGHLASLYSRSGSTTGYYQCHHDPKMISYAKPAYKSESTGFLTDIQETYCHSVMKKKVRAEVSMEAGRPLQLLLNDPATGQSVHVTGEDVQEAKNKPLSREQVLKQLQKTGESLFQLESIDLHMDSMPVFVPLSKLNELRREGFQAMEEVLLASFHRTANEMKTNNVRNAISLSVNDFGNPVQLSVMVSKLSQLTSLLSFPEITRIGLSSDFFILEELLQGISMIVGAGKKCVICLPAIYREPARNYVDRLMDRLSSDRTTVTFLVRNIDELGWILRKGISDFEIDASLYAFNKTAREWFYSLGAVGVTLPYELNYHEIKQLADERDELIVYGRIPLMVSAGCVIKNFDRCQKDLKKPPAENVMELKDRKGMVFPAVGCCHFCYNLIYNCVPLSLLGVGEELRSLKLKRYRINLTLETPEETERIIQNSIQALIRKQKPVEPKHFTRGHFHRGVD